MLKTYKNWFKHSEIEGKRYKIEKTIEKIIFERTCGIFFILYQFLSFRSLDGT